MRPSGIGGQAVLEGVMMKNKEKYAIAVRKPDNEINIKISEYKSLGDKFGLFKLPILRGMSAFIDSMIIGVSALTYSSSFYEEEEEVKKEPSKVKDAIYTFLTVLMSVVLAIGVFMLLPLFLSRLLTKVISSNIVILLIEAVIKIILFVGYVILISQMKDIKRFFMYHGAEHKTINCIERGKELTVENVRQSSKEHKRCGTSFMLYVILLSIIFFMFIQVDNEWLRYGLRILLVPVVAGVSYEFIRLAGRTENVIVRILSKPGLWMQKLTTKEPDDSMIEVAIQSVEAVFDWKGFLKENGIKSKRGRKPKVQKPVEEPKVQEEAKENVLISSNEIAASLEPDDEEEDEVLKALDRYFSYEKDKQ